MNKIKMFYETLSPKQQLYAKELASEWWWEEIGQEKKMSFFHLSQDLQLDYIEKNDTSINHYLKEHNIN